MSGDEPTCLRCGTPVEDTVQHFEWIPRPRDPLVHGEPGLNVLGHVDVQPCGCRLSPSEAAAMSMVGDDPNRRRPGSVISLDAP